MRRRFAYAVLLALSFAAGFLLPLEEGRPAELVVRLLVLEDAPPAAAGSIWELRAYASKEETRHQEAAQEARH